MGEGPAKNPAPRAKRRLPRFTQTFTGWKPSESSFRSQKPAKSWDSSKGRPMRLVSPSRRQARFTAGPMAVKSSRSAPDIAIEDLAEMEPDADPDQGLTGGAPGLILRGQAFQDRLPRRQRRRAICRSSPTAAGKMASTPSPTNFSTSPP